MSHKSKFCTFTWFKVQDPTVGNHSSFQPGGKYISEHWARVEDAMWILEEALVFMQTNAASALHASPKEAYAISGRHCRQESTDRQGEDH